MPESFKKKKKKKKNPWTITVIMILIIVGTLEIVSQMPGKETGGIWDVEE